MDLRGHLGIDAYQRGILVIVAHGHHHLDLSIIKINNSADLVGKGLEESFLGLLRCSKLPDILLSVSVYLRKCSIRKVLGEERIEEVG